MNEQCIEQYSVGPIGVNVYIINRPGHDIVVIDPGAEAERLASRIVELSSQRPGRRVILACTHGHLDHTAALSELRDRLLKAGFSCIVCAPRGDSAYFGEAASETNRRLFASIKATAYYQSFLAPIPEADRWLDHLDYLPDTDIQVIHTPGHSPGSSCFYLEAEHCLISGDTLFNSGRGRTDGFDADEVSLLASIRKRLAEFPDETMVLPGHGPETRLGKELSYYL